MFEECDKNKNVVVQLGARSLEIKRFLIQNRMLYLLLFGSVLLALSFLSSSEQAWAQDDFSKTTRSDQSIPGILEPVDPITAVATIGVDSERPYRRADSWVPLIVELTNHKEAVKGELVVKMKDGSVRYSTPIDLPTKAKKTYDLTVFFPPTLDELEFHVQIGRKLIPVETVTVATTYADTDRFVAVISSERGSHEHLAHNPEEETVDLFRRVIYTTPSLLPKYSIAYQNLDVLIWDGGDTTIISPEQEKALESWIQMGGTIVLAAGERWQELNDSPFRLYIPQTLDGSRVLNAGMQLINPDESELPVLNSSFVIATGELLDDPKINVLLKAGDDPFLVERKWGAGRIVFVASSISNNIFSNPIRNRIFNEYLTQSFLPMSAKVVERLNESTTGFLRWMIQAELPGTWFIAIYLGCYILLVVPINYIVFRMLGRLEWAWFTVPIWAIIFAYGAYYIGALRQQGQVSVNEISIVEARSSANTAQSTTFCSVYSPMRKRYTFNFDNPAAFPQIPTVYTGRPNSTPDKQLFVQYTNTGPQVDNFLIHHWSQEILRTQHESDLGKGVDIDLKWQGDTVIGNITNNTGQILLDPSIYIKDRKFNMASINDGETLPINQPILEMRNFNNNQGNPAMRFQGNYQRYNHRDPAKFIQEVLKDTYANEFFTEFPSLGMAILSARLNKPQLAFSINRNPNNNLKGDALLCQIFSLNKKMHGRIVLDQDAWTLLDSGIRPGGGQGRMMPAQGRARGGYGMGMYGMQQGRRFEQGQIHLSPNDEWSWDFASDVSLTGGKIESFSIKPIYAAMGFRNRNGNNSIKYQLVNGKPAGKEYEVFIQDLYSQTYHPISEITDDEGNVINPGKYIDKVTNVIAARIKAPPNRDLRVGINSFEIELQINYGTETSGKFLGYYVDAVEEDAALAKKQ